MGLAQSWFFQSKWTRPWVASICLFGSLPPSSAVGQETDDIIALPTFTVEAFSLPFSVETFPGSTEVITVDDLVGSGAQSLAQVLETTANLTLRSSLGHATSGSIDLRGYGEGSNLRTLILVDGLPLNRADMGAVSWLQIPLGRIERVEVLRGPQTARLGNFAVGGAINIITRLDPGASPTTQTEILGGSWQTWSTRLHHQRRLGEGALALAFDTQGTDGYRNNSGYEAISLAVNYARRLNEHTTLRTGLSYVDYRLEFPGPLVGSTGDRFPDDPRRSAYGPVAEDFFSKNNQTEWVFALQGEEADEAGPWALRGGVSRRFFAANFGAGSHSDNLQWQGRLTPTWRAETATGWQVGAGLTGEATRLSVDRFREEARANRLGEASLTHANVALFADLEKTWREELTFLGAVRFAYNHLEGESQDTRRPDDPQRNFDTGRHSDGFAVQLGLQWQPQDGSRFWLRYDRLYRFPTTDEIAFYQGVTNTRPFNDELEPEVGHNLETGAEWIGEHLTASINLFAQDMQGEIAYDPLNRVNENLADTRRYGAETRWRVSWQDWQAQLAYTWLAATFREGPFEGRDVPLVSSHAVSLGLTSPRWEGVQATANLLYRSRAWEGNDFANTQQPLPGWTTLDLAMNWQLTPNWMLLARLDNALDRAYATLKFAGTWYPAPGRSFTLGLRAEF